MAAAGSGSFDFGEGGRHALPAMPEGEEGGEDEDGSDEDGSDDDHHRLVSTANTTHGINLIQYVLILKHYTLFIQ